MNLKIHGFELNSFLALPVIESDPVGKINAVIFFKGMKPISHIESDDFKGNVVLSDIKFEVFSF